MDHSIPFHRIFKNNKEQNAVAEVLSGECWHGDGPVGQRIQSTIQSDIGAQYVYLTTSCTHALEIALLALDLKPGDEVIMPSFTFVSSANAALFCGATPVFAEICEGTLNLDSNDVARKITSRTRAIIPVHYAGVPVDWKALSDLASSRNIPVIEDAAQGVDACYRDRPLGTLGRMGCYSFHDTKNITCGEGGAIITSDSAVARRIELIREKGTNRSAFLRGEVDRYTWVERGSSYTLSDLLAATLEVQWSKRHEIRTLRKKAWTQYHNVLAPLEEQGYLQRQVIPEYAQSNYHAYFFVTSREADRDPLLRQLREAGIQATFHYVPLHNSPYGLRIGADRIPLPKTDRLSASMIRLPLFPGIHDSFPDFAERTNNVISGYFKGT